MVVATPRHNNRGNELARLRHLVVVIPGIGGSVLGPPDGGPARWELGKRTVARTVLDPARLSVDGWADLVARDVVDDLTVLPGVVVVPGYGGLRRALRNSFDGVVECVAGRVADVRPGVDVLVFPYDFRRGVRQAAECLAAVVQECLRGETPSARARRVVVVAHSLGGLVARYWIGALGGWRQCAGLVTLGTPHRGAPKALDWLVNGVRIGGVSLPEATAVLRGWPSVYELVPFYPVVGRPSGGGQTAGGGYPVDLPSEVVAASGGFARSAPVVLPGIREGRQVHEELAAGWASIPDGRRPGLDAVYAEGHTTLGRAWLGSAGLAVTPGDPEWLAGVEDWPAGDGTVPAISAIPVEYADEEHRQVWRPVRARHGPMGSHPVAVEILRGYAKASTAHIRGPGERSPGLGLDLPDFVLAGQPLAVGAVLLDADANQSTVLTVRLRPAGQPDGSARWQEHALDRDGDRWVAEVPPLSPGTYHVRVTAVTGSTGQRLTSEDLVEVSHP